MINCIECFLKILKYRYNKVARVYICCFIGDSVMLAQKTYVFWNHIDAHRVYHFVQNMWITNYIQLFQILNKKSVTPILVYSWQHLVVTPPFGMGVTRANFKQSGKIPVCNDKLIIWHKTFEIIISYLVYLLGILGVDSINRVDILL